jgi:hypothetical protein
LAAKAQAKSVVPVHDRSKSAPFRRDGSRQFEIICSNFGQLIVGPRRFALDCLSAEQIAIIARAILAPNGRQ